MVDVHSHILPNIDDGAISVDVSVRILREAAIGKFTDVICTPHFSPETQSLEDFVALRNQRFNILQKAILEQQISVKIHKGMEISFSPILIELINYLISKNKADQINELCLAGSRYMLLELPNLSFPIWAERCLFDLQLRGICPVIAHIERYSWINSQKDELISWGQKGIVFQLNASFIYSSINRNKTKLLKFLKSNGLEYVIGSDAHDLELRSMKPSQSLFGLDFSSNRKKNFINIEKCIENGFNILGNYDMM